MAQDPKQDAIERIQRVQSTNGLPVVMDCSIRRQTDAFDTEKEIFALIDTDEHLALAISKIKIPGASKVEFNEGAIRFNCNNFDLTLTVTKTDVNEKKIKFKADIKSSAVDSKEGQASLENHHLSIEIIEKVAQTHARIQIGKKIQNEYLKWNDKQREAHDTIVAVFVQIFGHIPANNKMNIQIKYKE